jgi:phage terminase small subunit
MAGYTMKLTDKQERFCQAIADVKTQADAYRAAYNAGGMKPEVVQNKASLLAKKGEVAVRIAGLRKTISEKHIWTRERSVLALADIVEDEASRSGEKVSAIKELNSMHGFNAPVKMDINAGITVIERRIVKATK